MACCSPSNHTYGPVPLSPQPPHTHICSATPLCRNTSLNSHATLVGITAFSGWSLYSTSGEITPQLIPADLTLGVITGVREPVRPSTAHMGRGGGIQARDCFRRWCRITAVYLSLRLCRNQFTAVPGSNFLLSAVYFFPLACVCALVTL